MQTVNSSNPKADQELLNAAYYGGLRNIQESIKQGANPNALTYKNVGALDIISSRSSFSVSADAKVKCIEYLLSQGATPKNEFSHLLSFASQSLNPHLFSQLKDIGFNFEVKDRYQQNVAVHVLKHLGESFLGKEVFKVGRVIKILNILKETGFNFSEEASGGETLLMLSAQFNQCEVMQWLISQNVDVNAKNQEGNTALHLCGGYSRFEDNIVTEAPHSRKLKRQLAALQVLMDGGADISILNKDQETCHEAWSYRGKEQIANLMFATIELHQIAKAVDVISVNNESNKNKSFRSL